MGNSRCWFLVCVRALWGKCTPCRSTGESARARYRLWWPRMVRSYGDAKNPLTKNTQHGVYVLHHALDQGFLFLLFPPNVYPSLSFAVDLDKNTI